MSCAFSLCISTKVIFCALFFLSFLKESCQMVFCQSLAMKTGYSERSAFASTGIWWSFQTIFSLIFSTKLWHFLGRLKQEINMSDQTLFERRVCQKVKSMVQNHDLLEFFQFAKFGVFINFMVLELKFSKLVSFWLKLKILSVFCQFHSWLKSSGWEKKNPSPPRIINYHWSWGRTVFVG